MGSVFRQKGRTVWMLKYYRDGRAQYESSGTDNKTEAKKLLRKRETDIDRGLPVSGRIGKLRFDEGAADVVNDYKVNGKRTLAHVERRIKLHLTPFFGGMRMSGITTADIRKYIAERQDASASNAEINRELSILKRAFSLAVQAGKLLYRPYVPMLQERNIRTGFFEPDQFQAVCKHLPDELVPIVKFAYVTGWRIPSEVLTLEWRQVDFPAATVRLDPGTTKNTEGRVFPFTTDLRALLEAQRAEHDALKQGGTICPYVFQREGAAITSIRRPWEHACKAAGCPSRLPHDLRRTAVRNMVRAGIPERVAMQLAGHKTRAVFERYNIVSDGDLRTAAAQLSFSQASPKGGHGWSLSRTPE